MLVQPYHLDLPANWDTAALRYLANVETGSGDAQDANPDGQFPFIVRSPTPMASVGFTYDTEAVLTAGDGNVGEIFHHIKGKFHAHQRVYVLSGFRRVTPRYFYYFFSSHFRHMAKGGEARTTVDSVRRWMITDMPFAVPPIDEQRAIADYLDWETQKIDDLITEQRGLIETLRERRRSLVTRLVTRGLDRHADMTEVSSKWLDFVPASWRLTRFRFVATIGNVMVDPKVGDVMHDVLIAPNHVERNTGRLLAIETADAQGADSSKYRVKSGQIVYSKIRPTLNKAVTAPCDCLCSADMYPISFDSDRVSNRYALYQMLSRPIHDYVTERSMRVKMPKVNREELADLPWLLPPFDVQEAISDEIDEQTSRIDEIISESEDLIALSQERRAALITAAVTGQIDVRTAA